MLMPTELAVPGSEGTGAPGGGASHGSGRQCDREAPQHPELRLDQIESRRFGRCPDRLDVAPPQQQGEAAAGPSDAADRADFQARLGRLKLSWISTSCRDGPTRKIDVSYFWRDVS
jgi:hypothetical protein